VWAFAKENLSQPMENGEMCVHEEFSSVKIDFPSISTQTYFPGRLLIPTIFI
jgi:hypothetical protein